MPIFRLHQVVLPLEISSVEAESALREAVIARLGLSPSDLGSCRVVRRSLDARPRRGRPVFVHTVDFEIAHPPPDLLRSKLEPAPDESPLPVPVVRAALQNRPVVVGAGPAGLLAAYRLAEAGLQPLILERGPAVTERTRAVASFWKLGTLDPEANVLFGEGGAGLYSDGKLTCRTKDRRRLNAVLQVLVNCGAPASILVEPDAHLGTDRLRTLVPALRQQIETLGGTFCFGARVDGVEIHESRLRGVFCGEERIAAEHCVLAPGLSATDLLQALHAAGVTLEVKPFAVGVRVEVPQEIIDRSQYGAAAGHPHLGAASFHLTCKGHGERRDCYSFCMCPGGTVIPCASAAGQVVTNGMSGSARSRSFGNAAFLVPVTAEDFGTDPLAALAWRERLEAEAFRAGGGDYSMPACSLADVLRDLAPTSLPENRSWPRCRPARLLDVLPPVVAQTLRAALPLLLRPLNGLRPEETLLYGVETRSSSPVRIVRLEDGQSPTASGLYPVGEGAGYAGGIISSAIDGLRAADRLLETLA